MIDLYSAIASFLAIGSVLRRWCAASASSFRKLSSRSGAIVPRSTASQYRTAGLRVVAAIPEPTFNGELFDVGKGAGEAFVEIPDPQLAEPGSVEQEGAARELEELAGGRGVTPLPVRRAHRARLGDLTACEAVHQGRLADSRRAQQRDRHASVEALGESRQ